MTAHPSPDSRRRWLAAGLLLAVILGGAWAWKASRAPRVFRVLLLDPDVHEGSGLDAHEASALNVLVKDGLELAAGASVSQTVGSPGASSWPLFREDALVLRLAPRRAGEKLALGGTWAWVRDLRATGRWHEIRIEGTPPARALEGLLAALPLPARKPVPAALVPRGPSVFWDYLAAHGGAPDVEYGPARDRLEACAAAEPDCPAIAFAQGQLQFFHALQAASNDAEGLRTAEAMLERGLALCPHHPRGTWLLARLRTDTGSLKEALEMLLEARVEHPNVLPLVIGITYAGRYAGLLELAARAETRCDELSSDPGHPIRLQVTFLYRGEWDRYERTLWLKPGDVTNSSVLLFRGQLELARGRKEKALETFREISRSPEGYSQFIRLAKVFELILQDDPSARRELDALAESRVGLRVPDGEFILNMAEAYTLLGDLPQAQELAERAFYTGFTCARWYETNPLLKPLHGTPRWTALMQHVQERQALLEARFPESRWGL